MNQAELKARLREITDKEHFRREIQRLTSAIIESEDKLPLYQKMGGATLRGLQDYIKHTKTLRQAAQERLEELGG